MSRPPIRIAEQSVMPMDASGQLKLCSVHKKLRLEKFLVPRNVLDADGNVVDIKFSCHPDSECTNSAFIPRAAAEPFVSQQAPQGSTAPPAPVSDAMKLYGGREARGRYYDLANQTGGIDDTVKKVCFVCGLDDHERSDCPNQFCRTCRGVIPPGGYNSHICANVGLHDFIDLRTPSPEELKYARCSVCNRLGHLDCAKLSKPANHKVSCCSCGETGHHGFQCVHAPNDRWLAGQLRMLGAALTHRRLHPTRPLNYPSPFDSPAPPVAEATQSSSAKKKGTTPPPPPPPVKKTATDASSMAPASRSPTLVAVPEARERGNKALRSPLAADARDAAPLKKHTKESPTPPSAKPTPPSAKPTSPAPSSNGAKAKPKRTKAASSSDESDGAHRIFTF